MNKAIQKKSKIVFLCYDLINYYLCFHGLDAPNFSVVPVQIESILNIKNLLYTLCDADLVIFNRFNVRYLPVIQFLKLIKIPCYQFVDENFYKLENEYQEPNSGDHGKIKDFCDQLDGIATSSKALQNYYLSENIHPNIFFCPPILDNSLPIRPLKFEKFCSKGIHIAIVGGQFRVNTLDQHIIPALNQINNDIPITLYIRHDVILPSTDEIKFTIVPFVFQENYHTFILILREMQIDIVIHPPGVSANMLYKTDSIALTALYIEANLIVFDDPAFEELDIEKGVLKIEHTLQAIVAAVFQAVVDLEASKIIHQKLYTFCSTHFTPESTVSVLNDIVVHHKKSKTLSFKKRTNKLHRFVREALPEMLPTEIRQLLFNNDTPLSHRSLFTRVCDYYKLMKPKETYKKILKALLYKTGLLSSNPTYSDGEQ